MSDNGTNQLPPSIQGDGRKFVSLLKNYLKGIQDEVDAKLEEVSKIYNTIADTPDTIDEQVHSITVEEKRVDGNISLLVKWNSDNIKKYAGAVLDIKIGDLHTTLAGFGTAPFVKHYETTKTNQYLLDNIEEGKNYYIRVRGKDVYNAKSIESKAPAVMHYVEPTTRIVRPPYEGTVVFDSRGAYWSWKQYDQNPYTWTELRLDEHAGTLRNRLDLTTDLHSNALPYARTGTAYLFNKGVGSGYSAPLKLPYAKAVPRAPQNLRTTNTFEGLRIDFDRIPEDCMGANVYINGEKYYTVDNSYNFICSTGSYNIQVKYVDVFGEGDPSKVIHADTIEEIPPDAVHITNRTVFDDGIIVAKHLADRAVVGTKIVEGAITTDKISANAITSGKIATNAISTDKIQANAIKSEHMEINSIEGNRIKTSSIDADKLKANSITGDKLVADSITGDKIQAGSIGVDKLKAGVINLGDLSSSIQGGSVRIDGTGMYVGQGNGSYTKFDDSGLVWYDNKGQAYGAVRRMIKGEAMHGDRININWDTTPFVTVTPTVIPSIGENIDHPHSSNFICRAVNISPTGFDIEAYTESTIKNSMRLTTHHENTNTYRTTCITVWSPINTTVTFTCKDGINIYVNSKKVRDAELGSKEGRSDNKGNPYTSTTNGYYTYSYESSGGNNWDGGTVYVSRPIYLYRYDISKAPMVKFTIPLRKGYNYIEGVYRKDSLPAMGWWDSVGWIDR